MCGTTPYCKKTWFDNFRDKLKIYGLCGFSQTLISIILTIVTYTQDYPKLSLLYWTFYIFLTPITMDCWNIIVKLPRGIKSNFFCVSILVITIVLTIMLGGGIVMLGLKATDAIDIPAWWSCVVKVSLWLNIFATIAKYTGEAMIDYNRSDID